MLENVSPCQLKRKAWVHRENEQPLENTCFFSLSGKKLFCVCRWAPWSVSSRDLTQVVSLSFLLTHLTSLTVYGCTCDNYNYSLPWVFITLFWCSGISKVTPSFIRHLQCFLTDHRVLWMTFESLDKARILPSGSVFWVVKVLLYSQTLFCIGLVK